VIGADGIGSVVRHYVAPDSEVLDVGYTAVRALDDHPLADGLACEAWGRDELVGATALRSGRTYWFFEAPTARFDGADPLAAVAADRWPVAGDRRGDEIRGGARPRDPHREAAAGLAPWSCGRSPQRLALRYSYLKPVTGRMQVGSTGSASGTFVYVCRFVIFLGRECPRWSTGWGTRLTRSATSGGSRPAMGRSAVRAFPGWE
jgi:hypothetical protein